MSHRPQFSLSPKWQIKTIRTRDGAHLRAAFYQQEPGLAVRKAILLVNGRTEFIEKYDYLVDDLGLAPDCALITWDHRGQGASSGHRSFIDDYRTYATDAQQVLRSNLQLPFPYLVIAHSMGALVALYATLTGVLRPERLILSSPLLGLPERPLPLWATRTLAAAAWTFGLGRQSIPRMARTPDTYETNPLTSSLERYARMQAAPYPPLPATYGWVRASLAASKVVFNPRLLKKLSVPVHIFCAEHESVISPEAIELWCSLARGCSQAPISCETILGARHELFSESPALYDASLVRVKALVDEWWRESLDGPSDSIA